jgi:asparagine synthase (glutamine-hydrolysing)
MPFVSPCGRYTVTADVRLDNRRELIDELELSTLNSEDISDSQLIIRSFEKWGENCPKHLIGDFAFAIWNEVERSLFCARDPFGVKPFYYHYNPGRVFIFASEIKGVLAHDLVPRKVNETRIADYLANISEDKESTFYDGILRLQPAHSIKLSSGGVSRRKYWALDPTKAIRLRSNGEYAEAVKELFTEAVRCRLRSGFPVGSMLSGGLDSSSITCTARDLLRKQGGSNLTTFSAVFDEVKQCDEREFAAAVLAQNHVKPTLFSGDKISPMREWEAVLWSQDEPLTPSNLYLNMEAYRLAREAGVRVVLDGFDGDTTLSHGTGWFVELARDKRWLTLAREASGYASYFENCPPWEVVWWNIERYGLHPRIRRAIKPFQRAYRRAKRRTAESAVQSPNRATKRTFINKDFATRMGLDERVRDLRKATVPLEHRSERLTHFERLNWAVMPGTLEVLNKAASAFAVDVRFPFWDRRLVEFCLALPPEQKLNKGLNRIVMRRAMDGVLPEKVLWRGGKTDMTPSFNYGILNYERDRLTRAITKNSHVIEEYSNVGELQSVLGETFGSESSKVHLREICKHVSLALWLERTGMTQ